MGSGYFPLNKKDVAGGKLLKAKNLIDEVIRDYYEDIYSGIDGQYDNAASDGGSLALLGLCIEILEKEVLK